MSLVLRTRTASIRTAVLAPLVAIMLVALGAALQPADAAAASRTISDVEIQQVRFINNFRAARGLRTLRIDGTLSRTATWMGADMAVQGYFGHTDSLGRDPFQRLRAFGYPTNSWRGENLAAGYPDAWNTFKQWRDSPPHRANWTNANYNSIGIARVYNASSKYGYYWVTEFGSVYTGAPA